MAALAFGGGQAWAQQRGFPREAEAATGQVRPLLGAWDLELVGGPRKCTIVLGAEAQGRGRKLRFPAICRRGLPVVAGVAAWSLTPQGQPRLDGATGEAVLSFARGEAGLEARAPGGELYRLEPKSYARLPQLREPGPAERAATAAQRPTAVDPARAPASDSLPGLYAVSRQPGRETCRLALSAPAAAAFEGRCEDTGLTIFNPVGWRYEAGRLRLIARKGHSVELVFENGRWRKDPDVGAPLLLRKATP